MNNFTKILKESRYAEVLVGDINLSTIKLETMNLEELEKISSNINIIIGALDDLKTSLMELKTKKEPKNVIDNILEGYIEEADKNKDNELKQVEQNLKKDVSDIKDIGLKKDLQKDINKSVNNINSQKITDNNKENKRDIAIPNIIELAIELCNKYNIHIPMITNGLIKKWLYEGKIEINNLDTFKIMQILKYMYMQEDIDIADKIRIKETYESYYQKYVIPQYTNRYRKDSSPNLRDICSDDIIKILKL